MCIGGGGVPFWADFEASGRGSAGKDRAGKANGRGCAVCDRCPDIAPNLHDLRRRRAVWTQREKAAQGRKTGKMAILTPRHLCTCAAIAA